MTFHPFELEEFMSTYEQGVDYHFAESGVEPVKFGELLEMAGLEAASLNEVPINYPEVNGEAALRERIASFYPGATADNVLVTIGASEANFIAAEALIEPGDEMVIFSPAYLQASGVARNRGATIKTVELDENAGWRLDTEKLDEAVTDKTKMIAAINPNNPTGSALSEDEREGLFSAAERVGAWLLVDEVYAGAERERNQPTPTLYGRYERTIAVNSMSKAYGLPGLRLGWVVAPADMIQTLWRHHEYTAIAATMLSNRLAAIAMSEEVRHKLIERTRGLIRRGFDLLCAELQTHDGVFSIVPPDASAMAFVKFDLPMGSTEFALKLLAKKNVLVVPGDCFGIDKHLRVSSALPPDYVRAGLARVNDLVGEILGVG